MSSARDVIRQQLQNSQMLIEKFSSDLTDQEYFVPAVPGANHAAWIVGHIAVSEDFIVGKITGKGMRLPQAMHDVFNGKSVCHAGASKYPPRRQIDELHRTTRAHSLEDLSLFPDTRWSESAPAGMNPAMFPTLGAMWGMIGAHPFWHIGQLTTNRVALKKGRILT